MSRATRAGLVALAVVIALVAFLIARPAEEETTDRGTRQPAVNRPAEAEPAAPRPFVVRVRGGAPIGGPRELTVKRDERVRVTVRTIDTTDEVHLHGYDLTRAVAPGRPARFRLVAEDTGIYEMELHHSDEQIAELRVEP